MLAKADVAYSDFKVPEDIVPEEYDLIAKLSLFHETISSAAEKYEPSFITRYAIELAELYNKFYIECKILSAEDKERVKFRLALTKAVRITLENALSLLGIAAPERM